MDDPQLARDDHPPMALVRVNKHNPEMEGSTKAPEKAVPS